MLSMVVVILDSISCPDMGTLIYSWMGIKSMICAGGSPRREIASNKMDLVLSIKDTQDMYN